MLTFSEWRRRVALPDPRTMLAMLGIDPHGPHDVEVLRLTKELKKADGLAAVRIGSATALSSRPPGRARRVGIEGS
jgi:hypothetical protein